MFIWELVEKRETSRYSTGIHRCCSWCVRLCIISLPWQLAENCLVPWKLNWRKEEPSSFGNSVLGTKLGSPVKAVMCSSHLSPQLLISGFLDNNPVDWDGRISVWFCSSFPWYWRCFNTFHVFIDDLRSFYLMSDLRSIAVRISYLRFWKNLLVYLASLQFNLRWETLSASVFWSVIYLLEIDTSNFPQF